MSEPRRTIMEMDVAHSRGINWRAIPYVVSIAVSILGLIFYFGLSDEPLSSTDAVETNHLIVRSLGADSISIKEVSSRLEADFSVLLDKLKVERTAKVFIDIYPDRETFDKDLRNPDFEFSEVPVSMSEGRLSIIFPSNNEGPDMDPVYKAADHQLIHFIADNIQASSTNIKWLKESIAMYYGGQNANSDMIKSVVRKGYPKIDELNDSRYADLYSVGYILAEFIADKWGEESLVELLAFNGNIPQVLKISKEDFEKEWHQYLEQKYIK